MRRKRGRRADVEDRMPCEVVDQHAADEDRGAGGHEGCGRDHADAERNARRRQAFAHEAEAQRQHGARHALNGAPGDHADHAGGERADQRAGARHRQHAEQHAAAPEHVAQARAQRGRCGRGEQEGGDDPADHHRVAELGVEGAQRGEDHRRFDSADHFGQHEGSEHDGRTVHGWFSWLTVSWNLRAPCARSRRPGGGVKRAPCMRARRSASATKRASPRVSMYESTPPVQRG